MVKPSKSVMYAFLNVLLGTLLYVAYRYWTGARAHIHSYEDSQRYITIGLVLYVVSAVVIFVRACMRADKREDIQYLPLANEAAAYGALGAERLKNIMLVLQVTTKEYGVLKRHGTLRLPTERFHVPIRNGDMVDIRTGQGSYFEHAEGKVMNIDGYNNVVVLTMTNNR